MVDLSVPTSKDTLSAWLEYMGSIHVSAIDMGLERVRPVFEKLMSEQTQSSRPVIFMVAGTNGKGSTTAMIAKICQEAGYKTALYQSPHLVSFTERIRLDGVEADEQALIEAFVVVEEARKACHKSLSFFEMTTLAAFWLFARQDCDVWVLEVGLGGRLDVVNLIDADVCVITNVAIDHVDWLGDTREKIGVEKAGILRQGGVLVYGEQDVPKSVVQAVDELGVRCYAYGQQFWFGDDGVAWTYSGAGVTLILPKPKLALINASTAVTAVLASRLTITQEAIDCAMTTVQLAGRFDRRSILGREWLFDVAHNEAGVRFLLSQFVPLWTQFKKDTPNARLMVVFSMLADKDIQKVLACVETSGLLIDVWHTAAVNNTRAMSGQGLVSELTKIGANVRLYDDVAQAVQGVVQASADGDFVLVFGSFYTISESLVALGQYRDFKAV